MAVCSDFWRGRSVFLTGHTGFKGSWLSVLLSDWGCRVFGYALPAATRSIYRSAGVQDLIAHSEIADVRDLNRLTDSLAASDAEIVFHMAAQPLVRLSYREPVETYAINVMGTVNLLEACRRADTVKAVVVITSDKCYENREWVWGYRETEAMGGHDPYSNSKGCVELVTAAYRDSFLRTSGRRVGSGRAGNVVGGGDHSADRLLPDLVRSIVSGGTAEIRNPAAVRPWQHVLEPLSGYLRLAERLAGDNGEAYAEGWNFGPGSAGERTVRDVAEATSRHWGAGIWRHDDTAHAHEANYLKLDSSKSRMCLQWQPRWDFDTTIAKTVEWYKAESEDYDMLALTRQQISDYLAAPGT